MPWTAPSSPIGPCRTGNTTSIGSRLPSAATSSLEAPSVASSTAEPVAAVTSGIRPVSAGRAGGPGSRCQRPSFVMPIGMTSLRSGSSASIT